MGPHRGGRRQRRRHRLDGWTDSRVLEVNVYCICAHEKIVYLPFLFTAVLAKSPSGPFNPTLSSNG